MTWELVAAVGFKALESKKFDMSGLVAQIQNSRLNDVLGADSELRDW
jgi:hypothetical protein